MANNAGKGHDRRPSQIGREEEELNYKLAQGKITFTEWARRHNILLKAGKITRSGRIIKEK